MVKNAPAVRGTEGLAPYLHFQYSTFNIQLYSKKTGVPCFTLDFWHSLLQNAVVMKKTATAVLLATLPVLATPEGDATDTFVPTADTAVEPAAAAVAEPTPAVPAEVPVVAQPAPLPVAPTVVEAVPAAPAEAATEADRRTLDSYRGIVKVEVAIRQPDYATPWQSGRCGGGNGTGFMVAPGLFMTNAHVVANGERITVSPYGDARKYAARVKHVAHDADLALVEVTEDVEAFKDLPCLQFSD